MNRNSFHWFTFLGGPLLVLIAACSSMKTPATASLAVSSAAVESAAVAGGAEYAPVEMYAAREKIARANQAMAERDFEAANDWALQAQADAKLAHAKAGSAKAQASAAAVQEDIRVLREELARNARQ